jgi:hypothetical protein
MTIDDTYRYVVGMADGNPLGEFLAGTLEGRRTGGRRKMWSQRLGPRRCTRPKLERRYSMGIVHFESQERFGVAVLPTRVRLPLGFGGFDRVKTAWLPGQEVAEGRATGASMFRPKTLVCFHSPDVVLLCSINNQRFSGF